VEEASVFGSVVITLRVMHHAPRDDYTPNTTTDHEIALVESNEAHIAAAFTTQKDFTARAEVGGDMIRVCEATPPNSSGNSPQ
jgi:hypothetical protein